MGQITSSSQTQLRYVQETTWGETPTAGDHYELRMTGETLNFNLTKDSSKEINKERQVRSLAVTNAQAQGDVNFELSYREYEPLLAGLMRSNWTTVPDVIGAGTVTAGTIEDAYGDDMNVLLVKVGDLSGITKDQYFYVESKDADGNVVFNGPLRALADGTADGGVAVLAGSVPAGAIVAGTVSQRYIKIGNTQKSFTMEKNFTDTDQFFRFTGMQVSKMDLNLQDGSFLTGSFSFVGRRGNRADLTALPGDTYASYGYASMSAVDGVADVEIGGEAIVDKYDTWIKALTVSVDNQLEGQTALGNLGSVAVMAKTMQITGTMNVYLSNGALYDDFVASVTNSFGFIVRDPQGYGYAFVFDKIDFNEMPANASAQDQAVMLEAKWTAVMGSESRNSLTIYALGPATAPVLA